MARLASSDSFLPSGAHDNHFSLSRGGDSSVISPLSLPRNATHYFEPQGVAVLPTSNSHRTRGRQTNHFFSPRLAPTSTQLNHQLYLQQRQQKQNQHRSASLSPTFRGYSVPTVSELIGTQLPSTAEVVLSPNRPVPSSLSSSAPISAPTQGMQSRTTSADSGASLNSLYAQKMATLEKQNASIRQAWENERKYLEANRARAEEVYLEERMVWDAERAILLEEIAQLKSMAAGTHTSFGMPEGDQGVISIRGGGDSSASTNALDSAAPSSASSQQELGLTQTTACQSKASRVLARLVNGASGPSPPLGARISPSQQPLYTHQPRSHAGSPNQGSSDVILSHESKDDTPVPIIDVQIIHPDLEGIPIKKTAVERTTFTDNDGSHVTSKSGSAKSSPRLMSSSPDGARSRPQEKDVLKVLAAPEPQRLVINAGHTPNHSLSILPTAVTTVAHTTASSSGEVTPTTTAPDGCFSRESSGLNKMIGIAAQPLAPEPFGMGPLTPPDDDQPLKGFLGIRNQPAHDEIFFRKLDRKLEAIKSEGDVVPTVLKNAEESVDDDGTAIENATSVDGATEHGSGDGPHKQRLDADKKSDSGGRESRSSNGSEDEELNLEIPLKFKKSNNFGAPLGYGF